MQLPEFLFIEPQGALKGAGFILCTRPPYYIGKVWKFKEPQDTFEIPNREDRMNTFQVPGYSIFITPFTNLSGLVFSEANIRDLPGAICLQSMVIMVDRPHVLKAMVAYYLTEKIKPNEPAFRKYKL